MPSITADFAHLKMLGHVYVVEDAKDLAQIVRDVTRYGGAYRPEVFALYDTFTARKVLTHCPGFSRRTYTNLFSEDQTGRKLKRR